jgi:hypothetical protein
MPSAMAQGVIDIASGSTAFEAFGVTMSVATNRREARDRIHEILPPGWRASSEADTKHRLAILGNERGTYTVEVAGIPVFEDVPLDAGLGSLERELRMRVAREAHDRIFVHAGVVGHTGGALLLPGESFSGKTTLVAALVRAGATYYSDEYAALDSDGLVHPYPKPLSLRDSNHQQRNHDVGVLGGKVGVQPLPVCVVVMTTYRAGTDWEPKPLDPGDGALALLAHAVPTRERPAEALRATRRAIEGAVLVEGDRGEADDLAPVLLSTLEARAA